VKEFAASRGVRAAEVLYLTDHRQPRPLIDCRPGIFVKANHGSCWNILHLESGFYLFGNGARLVCRWRFPAEGRGVGGPAG